MKNVAAQIFEPVLVLAVAGLFSVSVLADMTAKPATSQINAQAAACTQVAHVATAQKAA